MDKWKPSYTVDGTASRYNHYGELCGDKKKKKNKQKNKTRNKVTIQPSNTTISLLGIYPRKPELKDRMYPNVLCSTIVNSQDMKST